MPRIDFAVFPVSCAASRTAVERVLRVSSLVEPPTTKMSRFVSTPDQICYGYRIWMTGDFPGRDHSSAVWSRTRPGPGDACSPGRARDRDAGRSRPEPSVQRGSHSPVEGCWCTSPARCDRCDPDRPSGHRGRWAATRSHCGCVRPRLAAVRWRQARWRGWRTRRALPAVTLVPDGPYRRPHEAPIRDLPPPNIPSWHWHHDVAGRRRWPHTRTKRTSTTPNIPVQNTRSSISCTQAVNDSQLQVFMSFKQCVSVDSRT